MSDESKSQFDIDFTKKIVGRASELRERVVMKLAIAINEKSV